MEKNNTLLDRVVDFSADGRRVIAAVLALSLILAGCSNFREHFFSSSPADSHAEGGRRAPSLNPGGGSMEGAHPPMQAAAAAPATARPAAFTPYDAAPGPMGLERTQHADYTPPAAREEDKGWFGGMFDGWFGDSKPVPPSRRRPVENMEHQAQPIQAAGLNPQEPPMSMSAPSAPVGEVSSVEAPKPLLSDEEYPALSAIPPTPPQAEQFRKDKTSTRDKFAEMEEEQRHAEAQRNLDSEPAPAQEAMLPPAPMKDEPVAMAPKESEAMPPLPPSLPPVVEKETVITKETVVVKNTAKAKEKEKEEGGLFSWVKNPFASEKKEAMPARRPVNEPRELGAAPVMPVETARTMTLRAPAASVPDMPAPVLAHERPLMLREPKTPRYEEVQPGHLRLTPPASISAHARVLPQSRYAARRMHQRAAQSAGDTMAEGY